MTTSPEDEPAAVPPAAPEPGDEAAPPPRSASYRRRLTRSRSERWFGGVAGGLAGYWNTDPALIRVGWVVLAFVTGGLAIPAYVVLWIVMPEEDEGAQFAEGEPRRRSGAIGGVIWGVLLIAVGLAFLVSQADLDVDLPPWEVGLSIGLVLVGLAIMVEARRRAPGALIALAVLLTAVLGAAQLTAFDADVDSGFGERNERVTSVSQLEDSYSHAFGSMTIDLRNLADLEPGTTDLDIDIAFGSLALRLPDDVAYRLEVDGAFSSVDADEIETGGIALNRSYETPDYDTAQERLDITLSVVFGSAEVQQ